MSFDLLGILYRIYVTFLYSERFRIKRNKKDKKKNRKHKNYEICGKYQLKMKYIVTI